MPADDTLPASRLPLLPNPAQVLRYFPETFGIRGDTDGLDALPNPDRLRLAGARPLEPPEAVLLDRVLQLVPLRLLQPIERIVVVPTRGTGRLGGFLNGIVRVNAAEADVRRPDPEYGNRFSVFTTTVLHAIYETVLAPSQQDLVLGDYAEALDEVGYVPSGEPSHQGTQHHFIAFLVPALLGYGSPPHSAGASRRKLASFGLDLRQL